MGSPTWWNLLELLGVWVAAGATFFAARTALRIANREHQVSLVVSAEPSKIFQEGKLVEDVLAIKVTNVGRRPATITSLYWTLSRLTKHHLWQNTTDIRSVSLPKRLGDGDMANFVISIDQPYGNWYESFSKGIFRDHWIGRRFLDLRCLSLHVSTSTGETFSKPASKALKSELRKLLNSKFEEKTK